ncbi:MAG: sigma-70 family RNA polymerase sigma factor [Prochlorococcaceae cyanobacterium]
MALVASRCERTILRFLSLADALAGRLHRRFPDLLDREDLQQEARMELVMAVRRLKDPSTAPAYIKRCIHGALLHHMRDRALLVRLPAAVRGTTPWTHLSLDAVPDIAAASDGGEGCSGSWLDQLAAPDSDEPATDQVGLEMLLEQLPAAQAAAVRLTVLQGHSLRQAGALLGVSAMTVSRYRRQGLEQLRQLLQAAEEGFSWAPRTGLTA